MKLILLMVLISLGALHTEACSEPVGYEMLSRKEVLAHQKLIVLGTFKSQKNTTEDVNGYMRYILRLDTEVDCILRNKDNITIGRNIKISEMRAGGFDEVAFCTDYFCCLRFGAKAIISLAPNADIPDEFEFREYNLQGHTYYTDMVDFRDGQWINDFSNPQEMTEEGCPAAKPNTYVRSGVDKLKFSLSFVFLSILYTWFIKLL